MNNVCATLTTGTFKTHRTRTEWLAQNDAGSDRTYDIPTIASTHRAVNNLSTQIKTVLKGQSDNIKQLLQVASNPHKPEATETRRV